MEASNLTPGGGDVGDGNGSPTGGLPRARQVTVQRDAWIIYFPQLKMYYPHVKKGTNLFITKLTSDPNEAHIFVNKKQADMVFNRYNQKDHSTHVWDIQFLPKPKSLMTPAGLVVPSGNFAHFEWVMDGGERHYSSRGIIVAAKYDPSKSRISDPLNANLEVELIKFKIDMPAFI